MSEQVSPRPWYDMHSMITAGCGVSCDTGCYEVTEAQAEANEAYALQCVHAHEQLVDALNRTNNALSVPGELSHRDWHDCLILIRAALALARGNSQEAAVKESFTTEPTCKDGLQHG